MLKRVHSIILSLFLCLSFSVSAAPNQPIRVALDDLPGVDMLGILIAFERAKEKGVDIKVSYLQSEGMAMRSILNRQADIGMGTPYQQIQKNGHPIRMFYQLSKLRFHPMVNSNYFSSWKDLDGIEMYTHGSGSGTEAVMNMMAKQHNISYSKMGYLPGSGVRANAMIHGRIKATVVDTERKNMLLALPNSPFKTLPLPEINASDETLYAHQSFIKSHREELEIIVKELLYVWNETVKHPDFILKERERYNLLPRLKQEDDILTYYSEMSEAGALPLDGGLGKAFTADVEFYKYAGTIKGDISSLKMENYWDFSILESFYNP